MTTSVTTSKKNTRRSRFTTGLLAAAAFGAGLTAPAFAGGAPDAIKALTAEGTADLGGGTFYTVKMVTGDAKMDAVSAAWTDFSRTIPSLAGADASTPGTASVGYFDSPPRVIVWSTPDQRDAGEFRGPGLLVAATVDDARDRAYREVADGVRPATGSLLLVGRDGGAAWLGHAVITFEGGQGALAARRKRTAQQDAREAAKTALTVAYTQGDANPALPATPEAAGATAAARAAQPGFAPTKIDTRTWDVEGISAVLAFQQVAAPQAAADAALAALP